MITKFFVFDDSKANDWDCIRTIEDNLNLTKSDTVEYAGMQYKIESRTYSMDANVLQIYLTEKK